MTYIDLSTLPFHEGDGTDLPNTVLALGNFDGVHLGHRALLHEAVKKAAELGAVPGVWLFRAPPTDFLKNPPTPHLSTLTDKLTIFRELGIRLAFVADFKEVGSYSPEQFARELLIENCRCRHAVCGFNYSFGYKGAGDPALLRSLFSGAVSEIPPVKIGGLPVSSTRIRALLSDGNVAEASALLGREYSFRAPVLHGKALGRTLTFPTINQDFPPLAAIPKSGIYAVTVRMEGDPTLHYGVANVGNRPTVEVSSHTNCETYILDFDGDLYGRSVEIGFAKRLRDERKMSDIEELRAAIGADADAARRFFGISSKV